jgi:ATP-binding cassette subfamily B protein
VLLDEPFRGLDRGQRQELLDRVRRTFAQTTLLFVSHDIANTLSFPRVLVIEDGRLVEAGEPAVLRAKADSRYSAMLKAEQAVRHDLWAAARWERVSLVEGQLRKTEEPDPSLEEA